MLACAAGAVLSGIDATVVHVEVYLSDGLPSFTIVGLPDVSVQEARERVRAALKQLGSTDYPMCRITVNLAPSDVRKEGPGLDLPLALALVVAQELAPAQGLEGRLFLGELGLGGVLRPVRGALASAEAARQAGLREVVCPAVNAPEAALAGLPVLPVTSLAEAVEILKGRSSVEPVSGGAGALLDDPPPHLDLAMIRDQEHAKRALEIAAAGGHNLLLTGPPGAGKTLLARALPGILPRLTLDEALEVTRIHSAAGLLPGGQALVRTRPFRSPHHGVSLAGMVGGGSGGVRPGEISLAHLGVLLLDEFPEFPRSVLEALRQPLEDGVVTVTRLRQTVTFPARFMLIAAMNPCPCGMLGSGPPCRCTPNQRARYEQRLSGPLLDRIDLHVTVRRVETEKLLDSTEGSASAETRTRVEEARGVAAARGLRSNAEIPHGGLLRFCRLDGRARARLSVLSNRQRLSARAVHRVLRVALTIADLDGRDRVTESEINEAITYRMVESMREVS